MKGNQTYVLYVTDFAFKIILIIAKTTAKATVGRK